MIRWFALAVLGLLAPSGASQTCTHTWIGGDGHFNDDASWDAGLAPGEGDVACITAPGTYTVSLSDVRSAAERDRFGPVRQLDGLVVGGDSGVQTLRMTESVFEAESFEELETRFLSLRSTARLVMPGGSLIAAFVSNAGTVEVGAPDRSVDLGVGELVNDGSWAFEGGTVRMTGALSNTGEMRWIEATVELAEDAVLTNSGRIRAAGGAPEAPSRLEGAGAFVNDRGEIEVASGALRISVGDARLVDGQYHAQAEARLEIVSDYGWERPGDNRMQIQGRLTGQSDGHILLGISHSNDATIDLEGGGNSVFLAAGSLSNVGVLNSVYVGEEAEFVNQGEVVLSGGLLNLDGQFVNEGDLLVENARVDISDLFVNGVEGVIRLNSSDGQHTFIASIEVSGACNITFVPCGRFINRGQIVAIGGDRNRILGNFANEGGTLHAQSSPLEIRGTPLRLERGTYEAAPGHALELIGAPFLASGVMRGQGAGRVSLLFSSMEAQASGETGAFNFGGAGLVVESGEFRGRWVNLGRLVQKDGGFVESTFENRGEWVLNGSVVLKESTIRNQAGAVLELPIDGTFPNSGSLITNRGLIVKSGGEGTTTLEPVVVNAEGGEIRASSGTLALRTLIDEPGARYSGTGTLGPSPNFVVSGTIAPGDSANSTGVLTWAGPLLTSSSFTLDVDLNGLDPGSGHDQLVVDGDVSLAGTLQAAVSGNFSPEVGTFFEVLRATSLSGQFASSHLAEGLETRTGASSVDIAVVAPVSSETLTDAILEVELAVLGNPSRQPVVRLTLPYESAVNAQILDVRGREVAQVLGSTLPRGVHDSPVPRLPAGVYVVRATVGADTFVRRLTVVP